MFEFILQLIYLYIRLIDRIADLFYYCVSGCMTAQVFY